MNPYLPLAFAVCCEVIATLSRRASDGFSKTLSCVMVVLGYGALIFGDRLGWTGAAGVAPIVSGVIVLNISGAASH